MEKWLIDYIVGKMPTLSQDEMEMLLMTNANLSELLDKDLETKLMETEAKIRFHKCGNHKHHTYAEKRKADVKVKAQRKRMMKHSGCADFLCDNPGKYWGKVGHISHENRQYEAGRYGNQMSAKERRYAEAANLIDDCTMQEALETADAEIKAKRESLRIEYVEIMRKIRDARDLIMEIQDEIEDLETEKYEVIRAINSL